MTVDWKLNEGVCTCWRRLYRAKEVCVGGHKTCDFCAVFVARFMVQLLSWSSYSFKIAFVTRGDFSAIWQGFRTFLKLDANLQGFS